jgi:hypothetical protein
VRCKNFHPDFRAVVELFRIQYEKSYISTPEQNIYARYLRAFIVQNKFYTTVEVIRACCFKRNNHEFMKNGAMYARNGITQKYNDNFIGGFI